MIVLAILTSVSNTAENATAATLLMRDLYTHPIKLIVVSHAPEMLSSTAVLVIGSKCTSSRASCPGQVVPFRRQALPSRAQAVLLSRAQQDPRPKDHLHLLPVSAPVPLQQRVALSVLRAHQRLQALLSWVSRTLLELMHTKDVILRPLMVERCLLLLSLTTPQ
jgi:hypothetical protein